MPENEQVSDVNETVEQSTDDAALDTQVQETQQDSTEDSTNSKSTLDGEAAIKELEKVRKEAAKYRTKLRDLEAQSAEREKEAARAKLDETERLKAEKQDIADQLTKRENEFKQLNTQLSLQGKVTNPKAAVKLLEDNHYTADGDVDLDAFFEDYPEQKPRPTAERGGADVETAATNPPDVSSARNEQPRTKITRAEVAKMTAAQYQERRAEILEAMKSGKL